MSHPHRRTTGHRGLRPARTVASLLAVLLLVGVVPAAAEDGASARVINGEPTPRYDAMVAVFTEDRLCGGTLVHPRWVLTAAHCVFDAPDGNGPIDPLPASDFVLSIGYEDLEDRDDPNGEDHLVTDVVPHPDWRTDITGEAYVTQSNDLALLRMDIPSLLAPQRFADVDDTALSREGVAAEVFGYGLNNRGDADDYRGDTGELQQNGISAELLATDVPIVGCRVEAGLLCAGTPTPYDGGANGGASRPPSNDACSGDSGGPLTVPDGDGDRIQVGLVSYGFNRCGYSDGEPAAYTDVAAYASWIHGTIGPIAFLVPGGPVTEDDGEITVEVVVPRAPEPNQPTTVRLRTADATARAGQDYTAVAGRELDVSSGRATLTIPVLDDEEHEDDEVILVGDDDGEIALVGQFTELTIRDDDVYPMTATGGTVAEPSLGTTTATITFTIEQPADGFERFRLVRVGGEATDGVDVAATTPEVQFEPGATEAVARITVLDDDAVEDDEQAVYALRDAVGVALDRDVAVTITDDDVREVRVLAGGDRLDTAIAVSRDGFDDGAAEVVVLASATSFPDALVGTPLAVAEDGPLLLSGRDGLDDRVLDEVRRVLAPGGRVELLGGDLALSQRIEVQLDQAGVPWRRLAGGDRYATAVAVAEAVGNDARIFLATGRDYPDALAAGAAAATTEGVVLLTDGAVLPGATASALAGFDGEVVAVGGQSAAALDGDRDIIGATRYDTARLVAEAFFDEPDSLGIATGEAFPDALAGGAAAARRGGPLLLTRRATLAEEAEAVVTGFGPDLVRVFGGEVAVAPAVVDRLAQLTGGRTVR